MSKFLTRIIAALLVPCMAGDPALASAFTSPLSPTRERASEARVRGDVFSGQALALHAVSIARRVLGPSPHGFWPLMHNSVDNHPRPRFRSLFSLDWRIPHNDGHMEGPKMPSSTAPAAGSRSVNDPLSLISRPKTLSGRQAKKCLLNLAMFAKNLLDADKPDNQNLFGRDCQMRSRLVQYLLSKIGVPSEIVGVCGRESEPHLVVKTRDGGYIDASPETSADYSHFAPAIVVFKEDPEYALYESGEQNAAHSWGSNIYKTKDHTQWPILLKDFERIKEEHAGDIDRFVSDAQRYIAEGQENMAEPAVPAKQDSDTSLGSSSESKGWGKGFLGVVVLAILVGTGCSFPSSDVVLNGAPIIYLVLTAIAMGGYGLLLLDDGLRRLFVQKRESGYSAWRLFTDYRYLLELHRSRGGSLHDLWKAYRHRFMQSLPLRSGTEESLRHHIEYASNDLIFHAINRAVPIGHILLGALATCSNEILLAHFAARHGYSLIAAHFNVIATLIGVTMIAVVWEKHFHHSRKHIWRDIFWTIFILSGLFVLWFLLPNGVPSLHALTNYGNLVAGTLPFGLVKLISSGSADRRVLRAA